MAFYESLGDDRFVATAATVGPWDPAYQHAGPPAALLARALERCEARPDSRVARVAIDVLGPVPVGELAVRARVLRPGRSVELVEAELDAGGRTAMRATAWRVRTADTGLPGDPLVPPPGPEQGRHVAQPEEWSTGYLDAMEWRWLRGAFAEPGPAAVWARMRSPLVDGEEPSPLQRVLVLADSGNGASARLDPRQWLYINPELTVHLRRPAEGEWVLLDAQTHLAADGTGLAVSVLSDERGEVGRGAQALYVAPR